MKKEILFTVSAPSGAGKNTIINALLKKRKDLEYSISTTTRLPRRGEKNGVHYHFITIEKFKEKIENKEFIEYAKILSNYYGTSKESIKSIFKKNKYPIIDIDIEGIKQIKKRCKNSFSIFIVPPSLKVLEERLRNRNTETEDQILNRLKLAKREMRYKKFFDKIIVNNKIEDAVNEFDQIIDEVINTPV